MTYAELAWSYIVRGNFFDPINFIHLSGPYTSKRVEKGRSKRARIRNYEGGTCPKVVLRLLSACWWLFPNGPISLKRRKSYLRLQNVSSDFRWIRPLDSLFPILWTPPPSFRYWLKWNCDNSERKKFERRRTFRKFRIDHDSQWSFLCK